MRRDPRAFLLDVSEASASISRFLEGANRARYENDQMLQAAVERKFTIIGEALSQLSKLYPDLAARVPRLPEVIGFRNALIQGYLTVDQDRVWTLSHQPVADLRASVETLMNELDDRKP